MINGCLSLWIDTAKHSQTIFYVSSKCRYLNSAVTCLYYTTLNPPDFFFSFWFPFRNCFGGIVKNMFTFWIKEVNPVCNSDCKMRWRNTKKALLCTKHDSERLPLSQGSSHHGLWVKPAYHQFWCSGVKTKNFLCVFMSLDSCEKKLFDRVVVFLTWEIQILVFKRKFPWNTDRVFYLHLSLAAVTEGWGVATETVCPRKPEISTAWAFTEKRMLTPSLYELRNRVTAVWMKQGVSF